MAGAFPLVTPSGVAPLWCDAGDFPGVLRAVGDLRADIERVTGKAPEVVHDVPAAGVAVIVGTVGKSPLIDEMVAAGLIDGAALRGKWESFVIATVTWPARGLKKALIVAGSDKRGTIYGLYELSEQLGVSPWYWWADVAPRRRKTAYIVAGHYASGEPAVRYRGIFINDEAPCLTRWTNEKFGGFNSQMYTHMFELLLRLRANYLWPAMWNSAFNEDDADNPRLADEYGIVMGTSHHEPMVRAQKEWTKSHQDYGNGEWDYGSNSDGLKKFWREGIRRNKAYESLVTMGMRGDGDVAKPSAGGLKADIAQLEMIIADQREILKRELNPDIRAIPQLWALFTEVQKIYDAGVKVPDDVTLLFTDDNVGNLRRLPTEAERQRSGGAGIYYHFDMHGGPFAYQWINTNPFPKIWEQMNLAHAYGANRIWIVNVGDLKPLELPIEFFLRLAWKPDAIEKDKIGDYTRRWGERDFGPDYAGEIADIVSRYAKYNGWRKPEVIEPLTFSQINYGEAERVWAAWEDVTTQAEAVYKAIPAEDRDAYYGLVLHPAKASGIVAQMNIAAGRNLLYARQGRASTNAEGARVRDLFRQDSAMSAYYNTQLAGGKWNHLMDQPHIGQYTWQPPRVNMMPAVSELLVPDSDAYGVAIEGDESAWPDHYGDPVLPVFDSLNPRTSWVEVFAQGQRAIDVAVQSESAWISVTPDLTPRTDRRYVIAVDWGKAPMGESAGYVTVTGSQAPIRIKVPAMRATPDQRAEAKGRFASLTGIMAMAAGAASRRIESQGVRWEALPDYGRGASAMTVFPVTAPSVLPPQRGAALEYDVYLGQGGDYRVTLIVGPVMDFVPDRGMRIAVGFDDATPQVLDLFADRAFETFLGDNWPVVSKNNVRYVTATCPVALAGQHVLRISMVDPAIVVQKIILANGRLPDSYFGPPDYSLV